MCKALWVLAVLASTLFVKISAGTSVSTSSISSSHSSKVYSRRSSTTHTHSHGIACSKKCPKPNEVLDPCLSPCPPRICGVNIAAISCAAPAKCEPGCRCADGYLRNDKDICIPENECPKCPKPNEEYDACPALCPPRECGVNIALILCIVPPKPGDPECEPGCRCSDGYLRNSTGICIPEDECPKCTQPNEVYDECPAPCPPRRCDVDESLIRCAAPPKPGDPNCEPGCRCANGYFRNNNGICVTRDQCPLNCGYHEEYAECPQAVCRPKDCSDVGFPVPCPDLSSYGCPEYPACICEEGYARNTDGICIPWNECPSCAGDTNAVSATCGVNCNRHCSELNKPLANCTEECYYNSCYCRDGFYYDDNAEECVLPEDCTPDCQENEVYSDCTNGGCRAKNCFQLGQPIPCIKINPAYCVKGCICEEGFLRADNGKCVPEDQCYKCNHPHEFWDSCAPNCPPQTCESIGKTYFCPAQSQHCKGACRCEKGYYRNKIGECITEKDCLKCQGPHEYFSCGGACDNVCATYHQQNQTNCPIKNIVCNPMCYCEKGYARDNNNICVPFNKCPKPVCKENEVYDSCANGGCSKRNCSQIDEPEKCIDPIKCLGGCVCQEGYLRDSYGVCVPEYQCPQKCYGANEYYVACPPSCPSQTCESIGKIYHCPLIKTDVEDCKGACRCKPGFYRNKIGDCISEKNCLKCQGPHEFFSCGGACDNVCATLNKQNQTNCPIINIQCNEKCYCEDGYARDDKNICIPIEQCPAPCKKPHEIYDPCPNNCPIPKCESIDSTLTCPLLPDDVVQKCNGTCVCENGYYRNKIGECHTESDCRKCEGPNEYFSCRGACDNVCSTLSKQNQTNCPIINIKCNPMCYCDKDYARDSNGICIPINQCGVSCKGDPNAVKGCGNHCGRSCSDYNSGPHVCPLFCLVNGCDCKQNYVFDSNIGKCVLPKDCTPVCEPNEVYDSCVNGGCRHRSCSDIGGPILCIDPIKCEGGCICKDEYLRAENGTCIPIKQCPKPECKKNEVLDSCANGGCKRRKCSELAYPLICRDPYDCIEDCVCVDGYLRNEYGVCVPENQCPRQCKNRHEVYNSCPSDCPPQTCESLDRAYICPILQDCECNCPADEPNCECDCCKGDCVCENGYYRNLAGECISEEDCLKCEGHYEYYSCRAPCDNVCETLNVQNQTSCPLDSIECKCFCADNYARDKYGNCILIDDCPVSCGGDPNAVSGCGNKCGKSCSDYQDNVVCPLYCLTNGCDCKDGYIYDEASKKCVHPEECPPKSTTPPPSTVNSTEALARLNEGSIALTGEFLYQLLTSKPNSNIVASATSVQILLAQLAYFATGLVSEQLLRVLNLRSKDEITSVFPDVIADYENQTQVIFEIANKFYSNINYPLSEEFKQFSLDIFHAGGENVDFSKSVEVSDIINAWVAQRTHDKIKDLVSPDMFDGDTRLVLCNAIYFLGNWLYQFNPNNTETKDFYTDNTNTIQLPLMYQERSFNYYEDDGLNIQALEMPYKNDNFTFLVILPRAKGYDAVKTVADKLRDPKAFTAILDNMSYQKVQVYLPRMLISTSIDVAEILKKDNVTEMFSPDSNGFSGILKKPEPIYVSAAVQKAFISVDETGTEAAAATAITVTSLSLPSIPPPVYVFNANHPYLYFIKQQKTLVFCGAFLR